MNLSNSIIFSFIFISFVICVYSRKLPSFVEVCHRTDPKFSDCFRRNIEILRPKFLDGIPELYIPSFNPLLISEATLEGGVNFKATFKDIKIYNAENFVLESVVYDWDNLNFTLVAVFPSIRIKSNYKLNGRLLVLTLDGSGPADGNYTNVRGILAAHATKYTKNGKTFLKLHEDKVDLDISKAHLQFDNLFGDNEELNERTNSIINENIVDIIAELKPVVTKIISAFGFGIVNRIYEKYSFDDLFPQ